jgi:hypothetical protein
MYKKFIKKIKSVRIKNWNDWKLWHKLLSIFIGLIILVLGVMYGIARWYIASQANTPLTLGVSFIPDYAQYLGVDPEQAMKAMINDLGVHNFRLTSYWSDIEPSPGVYDFSQLDWEFALADQTHSTVSLSIGLRQPRWPECHEPTWVQNEPKSVWYPQLQTLMGKVIERYKGNPALINYELENEYFLKVFGTCTDFSRTRLVDEFNYVKQLDPNHPVIISRSNNAIGLPIGKPTPDIFGVSVYKRVYDQTITHRYYEYPFPAWFYGFLAGAGEILTGKNMIIHELQAEPWPPGPLSTTSIAEQNKSMDAARLKSRFQYGVATGIKTIYLWGSEWWYDRLVNDHDPSLWNVAKSEFAAARASNTALEYRLKNQQTSKANSKASNFFASIDKNDY